MQHSKYKDMIRYGCEKKKKNRLRPHDNSQMEWSTTVENPFSFSFFYVFFFFLVKCDVTDLRVS